MKVSKDELKLRVLENIKANQRKRQIQSMIEEILDNPEEERLDEKSKRGRAQRKKARAQAKKDKAKAAKAEQAEAPAEEAPAGEAPAADAPKPEGEEPKAGGPSVGGLKAFAAGMMKDPKKAMGQLGKDTKQYLKDNPEVAKELTAAMEAGENAKVEDLLGGLPGQDALIDAGEKIASGDVEGLEGVGAAAGAALAGGYGVEAAQLLGGAAGMALNNFADVTKNAETLAGTIIPQLSTLSKFLLDSDAADLKKVGAELKGLNKMFDEKLGFLMKASAKKAKEGGETPSGGAAAAADVPPELTDEQKADMSPEEIKAYEEKRQGAIQAVQRGTPGAAAEGAGIETSEAEAKALASAGVNQKVAEMDFAAQDKVRSAFDKMKSDTTERRALGEVIKKFTEKNKIDQVYYALMQTDKSAFGKTKSAKIGAPIDYYFKKYLPYLNPQLASTVAKRKIENSQDFVRFVLRGNVVDKDTLKVGDEERGAMQSVQDFFARTGPNSALALNTAEKEEAMHFITRLVTPGEGKRDEVDQAWETYGMGSKAQSAWKKNAQEAKQAPSNTTGMGARLGRNPVSIYRRKGGKITGLSAEARRAIEGDVPEGYTPPKGFDASKYKALLGGEGGGEATPEPAAKEEPKK